MQPGDTITPKGSSDDPVKPERSTNLNETPENNVPPPVYSPPEQPAQNPPLVASPPPSQVSSAAQPDVVSTPAESPSTLSDFNSPSNSSLAPPQTLDWTASEFIEHQKPSGWYLTVIFVTALLSGAVYLMTQDVIPVIVVALASIMFAIVGARKPKSLNYGISQTGLQVGDKVFPYADFKSFSVIEEGAIDSIHLLPLKRFMPPINLYFPPEQEEQIVDTLAAYLPYEERKHDPIDRLMKRVRF